MKVLHNPSDTHTQSAEEWKGGEMIKKEDKTSAESSGLGSKNKSTSAVIF